MPDLKLTGQTTYRDQIAPKLNQLKTLLDARKDVWGRCSVEKKRQWIKSDKDPVMTLAWQIYKYLRDNFFGEVNDG